MKLTVILFAILGVTMLHAQVPQLIGYQGRLAVGTTNFNGSGQFKFALVNTDGSTTYWSNDGSSSEGGEPAAAVTLNVTQGLYSVLLGDTVLANMSGIPAGVFSNADVRLRVWFNDGVNGFQMLTPDQRIAAVGYALMAAGVELPATTSATDGVILQGGSPLLHTFGSTSLFAGAGSGNFTQTGYANVAFGSNTLTAVTTGHKNTAIGSGALAANDAGIQNTAVGYVVLTANTSGTKNTASGTYSLSSNTTGNNNTASGLQNNLASNNTAAGYQALIATTTGNSNTAFGWQSLSGNTTGGSNIALGNRAGQNLTTGSNNIDIGHSGVAGESNTIRIGDGTTQTDTYLTGVVHGNGSGLTGITATSLAAGSVTSAQLASGAVGSAQLASGAVATSLAADNQSAVVSGGVVMSADASSASLLAAGYSKLGQASVAVAESWASMQTAGAPTGRAYHCAVWSGTELILWGGKNGSGVLNTGGRYNPTTNSWIAISTTNAPVARYKQRAVWTGTEMIVWGGNDGVSIHYNTGGRYNPTTDTWTATATLNAPSARTQNTAVWTGTE
ncbi:MAG: hypothetical protein B7Z21_00615, partial [Verrucomicrobiales bacterium 32-60-5]